MKWKIESPKSFKKKAAKLFKKTPHFKDIFREVMKQMTEDPFHFSLKTHPLHGKLKGRYACSLTDDLRIVFKLSSDTLHLLDIGSHEEVY